jgi:hypothetical protein
VPINTKILDGKKINVENLDTKNNLFIIEVVFLLTFLIKYYNILLVYFSFL